MKRLLVNFRTVVNQSMIKRETRNGDEFVIIRSATLPDNCVMNGGLYPGDEIEKAFMTLDGKMAPLGHPQDANGNFVLAASQYSIDNFYVGAFNENVTRENGRVFLDKAINVSKAMSTDKGKRLMDRIKAIENGAGEPIHTSTGVLLQARDGEGVNHKGQEYTWIAENMVFDHDAILIDEPGAATPEDGVGIAVNSAGDKFDVQFVDLEPLTVNADDGEETPKTVLLKLAKLIGFADFKKPAYNSDSKHLLNQDGDPMKNRMLDALKNAKVNTEGMDDDAIMNAHTKMLEERFKSKKDEKKANVDDQASIIAAAVTNALAPVVEKLDKMESDMKAGADAERAKLIEVIVNAKIGHEEIDLKELSIKLLTTMATNCAKPKDTQFLSAGFKNNSGDKDQLDYATMEAPE